MLHLEFAVAPTEVNSLADLALLDARLGFDRGAVLSGFPKAWFREVSDQLRRTHQGDTLDRATERLRAFKDNKTVAFNRAFEGPDWINSATMSHGNEPFHRVVEQSLNSIPVFVSSFVDLADDDFSYTSQFPRTAVSLAKAAKALLLGAEKVTIYDPYICFTRPGYRKTLLETMKLCKKASVDFHIFSEEDGKPSWQATRQALESFKGTMPENINLYWYCADDEGSRFLHARGLFTSKGGLIYDGGFEEPNDRDQRQELMDILPMPKGLLQAKSMSYNTSLQYEDFKLVRDVWSSHP
ncbi:TPA: hypothetical protein JG844_002812 [Vibrio parahaemolyticus]|uniref:hypothetical protein n=1 Tax=Vibrio TaxID=662 RepID=UPI0004DFA37F|nr:MULTISPECIES: hypothetical protein [Vibrio]MDF4613644.1 hypothetical protein [Vibrio parahaemolyticus]HAV1372533.1 hypothetical protein [Vibrio parahaemolyticus]